MPESVRGHCVQGESDDDDESDDKPGGTNDRTEAPTNIDLTFDDESPTFETPHKAGGDILMHNNVFLWHDLLQYWEFKNSVKEGDIGRTFEVIKVRLIIIWDKAIPTDKVTVAAPMVLWCWGEQLWPRALASSN